MQDLSTTNDGSTPVQASFSGGASREGAQTLENAPTMGILDIYV